MGIPQKVSVKMNFADGKVQFSVIGKDPKTQLRGLLAKCELIGETTGIGHVEFTDVPAIVDDGIPVTQELASPISAPVPKQQASQQEIDLSDESEQPILKRKRGRPPKSKVVVLATEVPEEESLPRVVTVDNDMLIDSDM